jgi:tetratricopeptide (TPR) repeat protein
MTEKNIKIFISYSWSNMDVADEIEKDLSQLQLELVRDVRDLKYRASISEFMEKIRDSDYAILLISDEYLKSKNCMKEVLHLLKDKNYEDKILPVIVGELSVYDTFGRLEYSKFWQGKQEEMERSIVGLAPSSILNEIVELKSIERIASDINEFLAYISDINNIKFTDLKKEGYKSLLEAIGCHDSTHLVSLLIISLTSSLSKKEILLDEWFENHNPISVAYSLRASLAADMGNFEKAEVNYEKSLDLDSRNAFAMNNFGYMLWRRDKDHCKAKELLQKAVEVMPNLTVARLNLGCILTDKFSDSKGAKEQYEKIISYNPTEERAYNNLANLYKENPKDIDNQMKICELMEKAIELNPKYIEARIGYGSFLSEFTKDFDKANVHFDAALEIDPDSKSLIDVLRKRMSSVEKLKSKKKVPRNSPCPCGSEKKYKKCHG